MRILHADFETTTLTYSDEESKVYLWGIIDPEWNFEIGVNIDSFFSRLNEFDESTTIYFHNGGRFDFEFIKHYTGKNYVWIDGRDRKMPNNSIKLLARSVSDTYGMQYKNSKGTNIYFRDSFKYLGVALKKLPGSTKMHKEVEFYDRYREYSCIEDVSQEDRDYLYEDIATQKRSMDEYIKLKKVGVRNYTKTSCAFKEFKKYCDYNKLFKDKITLSEWDYFYNFAVGAYSTGNESVKNKMLQNVLSMDNNSLYPFAMYASWLPYGEPIYGCPGVCDHKCQLLELYLTAELKPGLHPTLSTGKTSGETIEWKDTFDNEHIYTTNTYFDVVKKHYNIYGIEVIKKTCFEAMWGVAHEFFDIKMLIKEMAEEGGMERLAAKIDMNGCYGRFLMSPYSDIWDPILAANVSDIKKYEVVYGKYLLRKRQEVQDEIMYIPMAIFILSNARAITVDAINTFPENWVYSDTDSVKFINTNEEALKKAGFDIHKSRLGAWKIEWEAKWFYWQTRKLYFGSNKENGMLNPKMCATSGIKFDLTFKVEKDENEDVISAMNIFDVINRKYEVKTTTAMRVKGGILIKNLSKQLKS